MVRFKALAAVVASAGMAVMFAAAPASAQAAHAVARSATAQVSPDTAPCKSGYHHIWLDDYSSYNIVGEAEGSPVELGSASNAWCWSAPAANTGEFGNIDDETGQCLYYDAPEGVVTLSSSACTSTDAFENWSIDSSLGGLDIENEWAIIANQDPCMTATAPINGAIMYLGDSCIDSLNLWDT
jgi:hypothetical protein